MKKSLFGAIVIALLYSSCSDGSSSEQLLDDSTARHPMTFSVSQEPISRAVSFLENVAQMEQFYVVAQVQDQVYTNQFFLRNSNNDTNFHAEGEEVFWPNDSREPVTFYAVNFSPDYNYLREAVEKYDYNLGDIVITPISNNSIEVSVENPFYEDLVAAYSVVSANQTINGIAPLIFNHMLAEVEVYAKADKTPNMDYSITEVSFLSEDLNRIYNFNENSWSTGTSDGDIRNILYFSSDGFRVTDTENYVEILEPSTWSTSGDNFMFLIPGDYTLQVTYSVPTSNDPVTKTCDVTLVQNQKNRINLTLTPPVN